MSKKNIAEEYRDLLISTPKNMSGVFLVSNVPTRTNRGSLRMASQSPENFIPRELRENVEFAKAYKTLFGLSNETKTDLSGVSAVKYDSKTNTMIVYTTEERQAEVETNMQTLANKGFNIKPTTEGALDFFEYFDINQNRIHNNYCKTALFHELLKGKKVIMMDLKEEYKALCGTLGDEHIVLKREDKK